jgi:hypothetical protein
VIQFDIAKYDMNMILPNMTEHHQPHRPTLTLIEGGKKDEKPLTKEEVLALWDQLALQPVPVPVSLDEATCVAQQRSRALGSQQRSVSSESAPLLEGIQLWHRYRRSQRVGKKRTQSAHRHEVGRGAFAAGDIGGVETIMANPVPAQGLGMELKI